MNNIQYLYAMHQNQVQTLIHKIGHLNQVLCILNIKKKKII